MSITSTDPCAAQTVYFDGGCPVCSREIGWYKDAAAGDKPEFVDLSQGGDPAPDLDHATAMARLHVRRSDGRLVSGAAAFLAIWRTVPRLRGISRLLDNAPTRTVLDLGYVAFLKIRPLWRRRA